MEGMKFALGASIAVHRDALDRIGGIASLSDYCADDFILGKRVAESGYSVVLSRQIVSHILIGQGFAQTFRAQLRWMQSTRFSRPKGHLGTGLTFSAPSGLLGLFSQAIAVGWGVIRDRRALGLCWIYPLRDLLGFFVWVASYLCGREFNWRGEKYRFTAAGRFVPLSRSYTVPESAMSERQCSVVGTPSI